MARQMKMEIVSDHFIMSVEELRAIVYREMQLINFQNDSEHALALLVKMGIIKNTMNCPSCETPMSIVRVKKQSKCRLI